jgi:hypothetical protein
MMEQVGHTSPASLATAREKLAGAGTQTAALAFGGNPGPTAATEEWTGAGHQQQLQSQLLNTLLIYLINV